jgi:hypothetical protein
MTKKELLIQIVKKERQKYNVSQVRFKQLTEILIDLKKNDRSQKTNFGEGFVSSR